MSAPIVVVAQIKNEERSLPRFLQTCETFADKIILLDQSSTDRSIEIAASYPRVSVFNNPDRHLNEANTIARMYEIARDEVQGPKVILRLDADEVLSANATQTAEWQTLRTAAPGTVIRFPRIEIFDFGECYAGATIDRGYVDDGRQFSVAKIHAKSTPIASGLPTLTCHRIAILHYSGLRRALGEAKMRYYCMLDNIYATRPVFERRILYRRGHILDIIRATSKPVTFDEQWITGYEAKGIDMTSVLDDHATWHDEACMDLMIEHGCERFFLDPIWYHPWEDTMAALPESRKPQAISSFKRPPAYRRKIVGLLDRAYGHRAMPFKSMARALMNSMFSAPALSTPISADTLPAYTDGPTRQSNPLTTQRSVGLG